MGMLSDRAAGPVISNDSRVTQLVDYVNTTWMSNTSWTPASWCIYRESVCTNNDVEGWGV